MRIASLLLVVGCTHTVAHRQHVEHYAVLTTATLLRDHPTTKVEDHGAQVSW